MKRRWFRILRKIVHFFGWLVFPFVLLASILIFVWDAVDRMFDER